MKTSEPTSKNVISNGGSFQNSEATIAFVTLKRVHRWSQFLISSPNWPCTQNDASLNWYFHSFFFQKTQLWANDIKHRHIIYYWKWFFATIKNLRSLPENKTSFGKDQLSKFWQFFLKNVIINPATFIASRKHHYDEGDELRLMEPRQLSIADKTAFHDECS